jgi:hypothetical protein
MIFTTMGVHEAKLPGKEHSRLHRAGYPAAIT